MIGIRRKEIKVEEEEANPAVLENIPPTDPPEWTDPMRGILIALVEQHRELWECALKTTKNQMIDQWQEISQLLQNSDKRMTVLSILEKWCWMVEMHSRSLLSNTWKWRYSGVMSFLNSNPDNSSPYLGCISQERFTKLTSLYAVEDCEKLAAETVLPKSKRRSAIQPLFAVELQIYEKLGKKVELPESEGVVTRASGKLTNSANSLTSSNPAPRRGRPRKGTKINTIVSAINKNHEAHKEKDNARVANLELKLATTPKFNIEAVANLLDDVNKTEVLEPVETKPELLDAPVDVPSTSLGSHQVARVDQWTNELVKALIEEIKQYPALWHSSHPFFRNTIKRREYLSKVTEALHKLPDGLLINEDHIAGKWSLLRECFNKQHKKLKTNGATGWEFYESMAFLTPQVMNACRFDDIGDTEIMVLTSPNAATASPVSNLTSTPSSTVVAGPSATATVTTTAVMDMSEGSDVGSYLKRILGYHGNTEDNDAKKPRIEANVPPVAISTPCANAKKANATQAASTWVPPKEDSVAAAMQCLISQEYTPKATATAQITSSKSLSSILLEPVKRLSDTDSKKKSVSQPPQQSQMKTIISSLSRLKEVKRDEKDKWTLMGELVEQTCRELEAKSPALAVHLQKEINDMLFKYQLESVGQR
ncbi:unnamed protein product [Auanema sp. JU1783]|nr:unnamed protein product [Auanema sp. JU1783]